MHLAPLQPLILMIHKLPALPQYLVSELNHLPARSMLFIDECTPLRHTQEASIPPLFRQHHGVFPTA